MPSTILITGASTGIGRKTAELFRDKGWNVAATMRNPDESLAGGSLKTFALDVTQQESVNAAVQQVFDSFGQIDVLLNNAGYGAFGPFECATAEQVGRQFSTNVGGVFAMTRAVLPHFRERRTGVIINVSSVGGRATFPLYSLYHASKWAVEGFTEALRYELEQFNIRVKLIEPGSIATDFAGRSLDRLTKEGLNDYDKLVEQVVASWTANRRSSPSELVAEAIYQAATDGSAQLRYVVGDDAKMILEARKGMTDEAYHALVKQRFGI
jgi:NAD(P)-dependent dehydrogenase (short-subunit alcohol dehydrogenase family)